MDSINKAILDLMEKEGGAKKFAEKLGFVVEPQYFSNLRNGHTKQPSAKLILKIQEVYGVDALTNVRNVSRETITIDLEAWQRIQRHADLFADTIKTFDKSTDAFLTSTNNLHEEQKRLWGLINHLMGVQIKTSAT
jgi:transcriptional regulator with XRE-family HTH domain